MFEFDPLEMTWTQQVSYCYEFAIPISIKLLYEAICRFYTERREAPEYLFLAEEDVKRISEDPDAFLHRMVDVSRPSFAYIRTLANPVGHKPIFLIPLPDLPQRTVIFGFFRGSERSLRPGDFYYYRQGPVVTTEEVEVPHVDE